MGSTFLRYHSQLSATGYFFFFFFFFLNFCFSLFVAFPTINIMGALKIRVWLALMTLSYNIQMYQSGGHARYKTKPRGSDTGKPKYVGEQIQNFDTSAEKENFMQKQDRNALPIRHLMMALNDINMETNPVKHRNSDGCSYGKNPRFGKDPGHNDFCAINVRILKKAACLDPTVKASCCC